MSILKCAAARLNTTALDLRGNAKKILKLCVEAQNQGLDLVAFPELALTGYNCGDMFNHPHHIKNAINALLDIK